MNPEDGNQGVAVPSLRGANQSHVTFRGLFDSEIDELLAVLPPSFPHPVIERIEQ